MRCVRQGGGGSYLVVDILAGVQYLVVYYFVVYSTRWFMYGRCHDIASLGQ